MGVFELDSMIDGRYSHLAAANSVAGCSNSESNSAHNRASGFFVRTELPRLRIMVRRAGQLKGWPGSELTGIATPVRLTTLECSNSGGELYELNSEAAIMATIPTQVTTVETVEPKVFEQNGKILTTSLAVAEYFHKTHDNVLKKIRSIMADCDENYRLVNFNETFYTRENPNGGSGISTVMFELTRDAFVLIVMGFTGKRALQWKIDYINAFNRMEATLHGTPQALPNNQKNSVASRIMLAFDYTGKILSTEVIPSDAFFVGDINKFSRFAGQLGYLMFKEDELLAMLKGSKK